MRCLKRIAKGGGAWVPSLFLFACSAVMSILLTPTVSAESAPDRQIGGVCARSRLTTDRPLSLDSHSLSTTNYQLSTTGVSPLKVMPGNGLPVVECRLNGVKCPLLFDTGASHTTIDFTFLTNAFPAVKTQAIAVAGRTNVQAAPQSFRARFDFGEGGPDADEVQLLTIPLELSASIGTTVHGVLGMDLIGRQPVMVSLSSAKVVFNPSDLSRFTHFAATDPARGVPVVECALEGGGASGKIMIDTGSSLSFANAKLGWPADEKPSVQLNVTHVNASEALGFRRGKTAALRLGGEIVIELAPLLDGRPDAYLGADFFRLHDLLLEKGRISIAPAAAHAEN